MELLKEQLFYGMDLPEPKALPAEAEPTRAPRRPRHHLSRDPMPSRNDPCPCRSGAKFKRCCLIKTERRGMWTTL